ncbi:MAG TPA: HlyD family secretion protein [Steroidobacteraceae bacterium]|nr:HlyD family secretion protein [Steroidobacteraceae bacterium]
MNDSSSTKTATTPPEVNTDSHVARLRRIRIPLMIGGSLLIIVVAALLYFLSSRTESTDDAYVNAARVSISTNVPGRVIELNVHDNQQVKRGAVLFRLDDRPYQLAVAQARAKLSNARLQVESLKALYGQRQSELRSAQDTLAYQEREMRRQQRLLASGISSQSQVDRAVHARDSAAQAVAAAKQQIASVVASLGGDPTIDPNKHPSVEQAQAELDRALLDLSYTTITAPDDGVVTQVERLQVGEYVNAATPVFALVSTHDVWVEANFKEVQLAKMRAGQPATVKIDTYGDRSFKAHVVSLSPGTGSAFSVLPAQNATGNWVKVVQRLAVRLEIDDGDSAHPLYAGLSATVKVDTHNQQGAPLADEENAQPGVERVSQNASH